MVELVGNEGRVTSPHKRPMRPRELQDPLNLYLYHPLSWQLARRLAATPITPNMVSVFGGLMVVAAAAAYTGLAWPWGAWLGLFLHMGWHVVDGADGDLARLTGRSSPLGEMVDGVCDYVSHIVLYFALGAFLQGQIGWVALAWMWAAGISHIVQSNHVEVQRRFYLYWMHGTPWLHHSRDAFAEKRGFQRIFQVIAVGYLRLAAGMTPHALRIDDAITAAHGHPERLARIRAEVERGFRPLLVVLKLLGPNPRALVLGASMLMANSPLWYFVYQAVILNLLLVVSVWLHNRAAKRVAKRLAQFGL
ncbi:CDP-alcohol phosphatidyltransferase family protein [Novosphingobium lentum]|uniref:CDP-alcohol phosphatidyltransferase family protein n=1 Tax=Novosphingobium lentum TaxID=145287 RepID=UPI0008319D88|nr:CDP-alcohol phosphatidyltransferase family protein [Novosphingobium lentum]